ncbi:hypothetical protein BSU04_28800 [Caballeronia sordidicola]|jgi:hypothetical protein|uniref:Uncharacterized protein n=1 Tax=Caballeronia sordidicola TaxID=196367 RepID=A0A226WWI9_CABSO|nr:hypothetical protein BSU04_28800 [Caballeronia sordidicola]
MPLALLCRSSPGTAAIIRRASTFDDLYYPFSGDSSIAPCAAIPRSGTLIGNLAPSSKD